ncbi:MAG TPA: hypothetical protein VHE32_01225 [Rhodanobacteraceae bacterium]|jgi:hypothetical protein|nr:hypothetical protein [Rhodanobacteraceae bacterium]
MKTSAGEKVFWALVALSSIGAAAFGYHRFKQIRPDLYGTPQAVTLPETERKERIAEYQQKGDALTRAANPPVRSLKPGETCVDGNVIDANGKPVVESESPVRCKIP